MNHHTLRLKRMGIDSRNEHLVFMRRDCPVCTSEGFEALNRIRISAGKRTLVASLIVVDDPRELGDQEAGLTEDAIIELGVSEGDTLALSHLEPLTSMSDVRTKIFGNPLSQNGFQRIVRDIAHHNLSNIQLSAFLTSCAGDRLSTEEVVYLTKSMVSVGFQMEWGHREIYDKHCIGGLPGNRTSPLVVSIVAAAGLIIPKTSSRAITSPSGTADTMETLTNVALTVDQMRRVVEKEGACLAWGGSMQLSPADDILIRVERALDIDSEGQLIASVISKKKAAGATHVVIDIPFGPTAKMRSRDMAEALAKKIVGVSASLGISAVPYLSDGSQPVGRGIGPALEARDVLAILRNEESGPDDLRSKSIVLAGKLLELGGVAGSGKGEAAATQILRSGDAWRKFQGICEAQGGLMEPPTAPYRETVHADADGTVSAINNRKIAKTAKLAGAPGDKAAGVDLFASLGMEFSKGDALFEVHAESPGELAYSLEFLKNNPDVIEIT
jgi:thymidine phosphorylase